MEFYIIWFQFPMGFFIIGSNYSFFIICRNKIYVLLTSIYIYIPMLVDCQFGELWSSSNPSPPDNVFFRHFSSAPMVENSYLGVETLNHDSFEFSKPIELRHIRNSKSTSFSTNGNYFFMYAIRFVFFSSQLYAVSTKRLYFGVGASEWQEAWFYRN